MQIHPIASALGRNKTGLILVALQIALTLAIVCNNLFIINDRVDRMNRPSGIDEAHTFVIRNVPFRDDRFGLPELQADLAALRAMPGVVAAVAINSAPLTGGGWSNSVFKQRPAEHGSDRNDGNTAIYVVDDHGLEALGLKLVQGRNFTPTELLTLKPNTPFEPDVIIVSQALAQKLYPEGALGRQVWLFGRSKPQTIVGIVEKLQAPWARWNEVEHATLAPGFAPAIRYVVRTAPGQLGSVMRDIDAKLRAVNDQRLVHQVRDYAEIRSRAYRRDRAMTIMLTTVIVSLLVITGLGIVGLASFWVTSRTKQIGTRRALGARRADITRYFQIENLMITGVGLAAGTVLAYGLNYWLMREYDIARLAWYYVPAGAVVLALLGQLAVLGPARRGAAVPPAVATRSV